MYNTAKAVTTMTLRAALLSTTLLAIVFAVALLAPFYAQKAVADEDEYEERIEERLVAEELEEQGEEWGEEVPEVAGSIAFYGGLALNTFFVAVRWASSVGAPVPPGVRRLAMELHMDGNIALAVPAYLHGYTMLGRATLLEYAIGALITILLVSGVTMRYFKSRRAKLVARMIHGQRVLALLLLVLLVLHVASRE